MKTNLTNIAYIHAGHSFRGVIPDMKEGVAVVQMKNVSLDSGVQWSDLIHTELSERAKPKFLQSGCVLFVARGNHNFAVSINNVTEPTVCSPHFYQFVVKDDSQVRPEYLKWWINQKPTQEYLKTFAEGSTTLSVRRKTIENIEIVIPSLQVQDHITELDHCLQREHAALLDMHTNNIAYMNVLACDLLSNSSKELK